ncbi:MAG: hypothetical protein KJ737_17850 [Proteobacteria bacterium]|nr:hypothetical protein [Pseudomonadota bacterium]
MRNLKIIALLEFVTATGLILFWAVFFTWGLAPEKPPEGYFIFERSFPLPDIILAGGLICSGFFLMKNRPEGRMLSMSCAGATLFLGLLDFSFNIQNGMYLLSITDLLLNAFINLWCVLFGIFVIVSFMK